MKFFTTYKNDAPGGYGGTHWFFSRADQRAFVARAIKRGVGIEWFVCEGKA
jgi:hypothetical protein